MATERIETCTHHWILETPRDGISLGECKVCGSRREFNPEKGKNIFNPSVPRGVREQQPEHKPGTRQFTSDQLALLTDLASGGTGDSLGPNKEITPAGKSIMIADIKFSMGSSVDDIMPALVYTVAKGLISLKELNRPQQVATLTEQQHHLLTLLCEGKRNSQIGEFINPQSPDPGSLASNHLKKAYRALDANTNYEAAAIYTASGMYTPEILLTESADEQL